MTIGVPNSAARLRNARTGRVPVEIAPVRTERLFRLVPVRMRNLGAGLSAQSTPANARGDDRGDDDALKALSIDAVRATVDLAGLGAGRYTLPVRVAPCAVPSPWLASDPDPGADHDPMNAETLRHRRRARPCRHSRRSTRGRSAGWARRWSARLPPLDVSPAPAGRPRHAGVGRVDRARSGARGAHRQGATVTSAGVISDAGRGATSPAARGSRRAS